MYSMRPVMVNGLMSFIDVPKEASREQDGSSINQILQVDFVLD